MRPLSHLISFSLLAALLALGSCASAPSARAELPVLRPVDLALRVEPGVGVLDSANGFETAAADGVTLDVSLHFVRSSALEALRSQRGTSPVSASTCSVDEVVKWLGELRERGELTTLAGGDSRTISVAGNQSGHVHRLKRRAYVSGFELKQQGSQWIADPEIGVVDEGVQLSARGVRVGDQAERPGQTDVDVELRMQVLDHPLRERSLRLTSTSAPVTIQAPSGLTWTLRTKDTLADDEALVLAGAVDSARGTAFVAVLRPRPKAGTVVASAR